MGPVNLACFGSSAFSSLICHRHRGRAKKPDTSTDEPQLKKKTVGEQKAVEEEKIVGAEKNNQQNLEDWYIDTLDRILRCLQELENDTQNLERVYMTYTFNSGDLRAQYLHTHGHKYEIRRDESHESGAETDYRCNIEPLHSSEGRDNESRFQDGSREVGPYHRLIGCTTYSKAQIDRVCRRLFENLRDQASSAAKRLRLLYNLADWIVTHRAPDWDWFRQSGVGRFVHSERPRVKDPVIAAYAWSKKLKQGDAIFHGDETLQTSGLIELLESFVRECTFQLDSKVVDYKYAGEGESFGNVYGADIASVIDGDGGGVATSGGGHHDGGHGTGTGSHAADGGVDSSGADNAVDSSGADADWTW